MDLHQKISYVVPPAWISVASHAMKVIEAPAVAPESPKQAIVPKVGTAPFVLATTSGEVPVTRVIQSFSVYFDFW